MTISVLGAGAFGTSLALALARDGASVTLWCRGADDAARMHDTRKTGRRLPGHALPDSLAVTHDTAAFRSEVCLLAVPMQQLAGFLSENSGLDGRTLVACCKGIDLKTGLGPVATIRNACPSAIAALLTGPSFAADIAQGLPTALVLASEHEAHSVTLQSLLSRPALRLYRSTDVTGAELGGALKNVVALAAGIAIGAGLGDSARASVIARGFAEMARYAAAKGARTETIQGLSGLGDLVLTCTSDKSRNFMAGYDLGRGKPVDPSTTVEGIATAQAIARSAPQSGIEMPLSQAVAAVTLGQLDIATAIETLMSRPARKE
jgi:glycerol-3-phosphate dehydrogenase (NAD(P)+)